VTGTLFPVSAGDVALTTDEWYTPPWLFKAAGLVFDMDVCAPVDAAFRTCPAREYLTVVEDGLTADWYGTVWCNPPYSKIPAWADRFKDHAAGLMLVPAIKRQPGLETFLASVDALALLSLSFGRPDGGPTELLCLMMLGARGLTCVNALGRVAAGDRYTRGAYHVRRESLEQFP
jgi:hypothetical protein